MSEAPNVARAGRALRDLDRPRARGAGARPGSTSKRSRRRARLLAVELDRQRVVAIDRDRRAAQELGLRVRQVRAAVDLRHRQDEVALRHVADQQHVEAARRRARPRGRSSSRRRRSGRWRRSRRASGRGAPRRRPSRASRCSASARTPPASTRGTRPSRRGPSSSRSCAGRSHRSCRRWRRCEPGLARLAGPRAVADAPDVDLARRCRPSATATASSSLAGMPKVRTKSKPGAARDHRELGAVAIRDAR